MTRSALVIVTLVCVSLAVMSIFVAYQSLLGYKLAYNPFYEQGYQDGYQGGYDLGFSEGNVSGYNLAYEIAYDQGYTSGYDEGNTTGYGTGYDTGYQQGLDDGAGEGYTVRNPTHEETMQFIEIDQTDKNEYDEETYTCANFASDVKNHAFEEGYRCGYVIINFPTSSHAIVCFDTIDEGMIFIEPQDDAVVTVVIGQHYWDRTKYIVTYDDTIIRYMIVW